MIPRITEIHENYNVLIVTFASISGSGVFTLYIEGPYKEDHDALASDLKSWKAGADKWGRQRLVLLCIGAGMWGHGATPQAIEAGFESFVQKFGFDGFDVDPEDVNDAVRLKPVIQSVRNNGKVAIVSLQAAQYFLDQAEDLMQYLSWFQPIFFGTPPTSVTTPWIPADWPRSPPQFDWQEERSQGSDAAWWAGVVAAIGNHAGLEPGQLGFVFSSVESEQWNADALVKQVAKAGVTRVAHWSLAFDHQQDWKWAKALGQLNCNLTLV